MIDYEQTIQKIINSITNFSFEFDFELVKKEMELQEVSKEELEKLGENKVKENFNKGIYKIKLPNGSLIDFNSVSKYSLENKIKEPVIFINPNFKYVQWIVNKDFTTSQIKKQIKNQIASNNEINLQDVQKALLNEELKNKKNEGFIDELPVKTSNLIKEGKFLIQSSCSRESAIHTVNEVIEELTTEKNIYVKSKINRDYKNIFIYLLFVLFIFGLWFINNHYKSLPNWLSTTMGFILFLIPFVMRLINHAIFETLFFRKKAEKKYEKEFYNKVI